MEQPKKSVLIMDDHLFLAAALVGLLTPYYDMSYATHVPAMRELLKTKKFDVILLDLALNEGVSFGLTLIPELLETGAKVIVHSCKTDLAEHCRALGASGFINKGSEPVQMQALIDTVLNGGQCFPDQAGSNMGLSFHHRLAKLSPLQRSVFDLYILNASYEEIGKAVHKAASTVGNIGSEILSIFSRRSKGDLILHAVEMGYITSSMLKSSVIHHSKSAAPDNPNPRRDRKAAGKKSPQ